MDFKHIRLAIVEDNGVARINLRNNLMHMGFEQIGCYSQGRELRQAMRERHFDLVLMDYHLGMHKNGVEVIQELQQADLLKPSVAVIFITSDRMPLIFGQIVDVHPDSVVLKPYTIRNVQGVISNCLLARKMLADVYRAMDIEDYATALTHLDGVDAENEILRRGAIITKLRARLLLKLHRYADAASIYREILQKADKVIWARWGLVVALFLNGDKDESMAELDSMLDTSLTKDKACEWLARIHISNTEYDKAQEYLDRINESELTLSTARLKVHLYQMQEKIDEAIALLERKRESNRHVRERFSELSADLARVYLARAESDPLTREESLKQARTIIGGTRRAMEDDVDLCKNYITALSYIMEGDEVRANSILNNHAMLEFDSASTDTMSDAVKAWFAVGETSKASEIQQQVENRKDKLLDENEKAMTQMRIAQNEISLGDKKSRSLEFNKRGLEAFSNDKLSEAIDLFYQAHILFPAEPAFLINLFDAMVTHQCPQHKRVKTLKIADELKGQSLSETNKNRFNEIRQRMIRDMHIHSQNT
ncbi:tetratricopeptide repeat protein [Bowmanella sp. JS7-9]|uniref:Tetratricopeptide repeat protein n=1 Tax=Pseudobowmanella zhangzhouensis TaxID=1537679 RepID=A0ABW1XNH2_9ALTE|nr:tetratricopeptide repeat protein [Bowmanella sp. JS7-9]TBX23153.1 hypothetical protein TK45_08065 [Bowmanella sp. JS7-9]